MRNYKRWAALMLSVSMVLSNGAGIPEVMAAPSQAAEERIEADISAFADTDQEAALAVKLEAEDAELGGLAEAVSRADASGGKKVGKIDNTDSTVKFTLTAPEDGVYKVEVAADGSRDYPNPEHRYWVNGDISAAKVVQYRPEGWDNWILYPIEVELKKGENTLTFSHSGKQDSFAELDYIIFYKAYPELTVTLDGAALEGFDLDTRDYVWDVESLSTLPEVAASVQESVKDKFTVEVTQGTEARPEAYVKITSSLDAEFEKNFTIRFLGQQTFRNPLVNFGADPYVTYQDGYYYYIRVEHDRAIYVSKSLELSRIGQVEPKLVYQPSGSEPASEIWAPEIHYLNGKWYIYYTAGAGSNHRMYVLESQTEDAQGAYTFKGKMSPTTDKWAIDQTVLELDGQLYAIWSGWEGDVNVNQRIYIAKMENPWTISGERVELSKPEYTWEKQGGTPTINEGPQIVKAPDGTVNIVYSASGSWSDFYCLGCLTLKKGEEPLKQESWIKAQEPVFEKNNSTTFSTGHACFTTSPDGTEDYIIYHATKYSGDGWSGRGVRTQRVYWNEDGTPFLGSAIEYDERVNWPSGTPVLDYYRLEAEDAALEGSANIVETYNSSAGKKVTGLKVAGDKAVFTADVKEAGTYKLYVGAATGNENAGLSVQVNEGEAVRKAVVRFNSDSSISRICKDNWAGYELDVELSQGINTITVSKGSGLASADLDYIELEPCAKNGHEWDEGVVTKPATVTESGIRIYTCAVCQKTRKEVIEATGIVITQEELDRLQEALDEAERKAQTAAEAADKAEQKAKDAADALKAVQDALADANGDIGTLEEAVKTAQEKADKAEQEAEAAKQRLQAAQTAVDEAKKEAEAAREKAVKEAHRSLLSKALNVYKDLDTDAYTEESAAKLAAALSAGRSVFEDASASDEAVINAAEEILKAAAGLTLDSKKADQELQDAKDAAEEAQKELEAQKEELKRLAEQAAEAMRLAEEAKAAQQAQTPVKQPEAPADQTDEKTLTEGQVYTNGSYSYRILSNTDMTVEVTGLKDTSLKKISVYSSVKLGEKEYKVAAIAVSAFKNNKTATSVSIGKNVETIGSGAFAGCTQLKKVTAKSTALKEIGSKVFMGCKKLKTLTIKSKKLKKIGTNAFKGIYKKAVIKVPAAKYKAYAKLLAKKGQGKAVTIKK